MAAEAIDLSGIFDYSYTLINEHYTLVNRKVVLEIIMDS